MFLAYESVIQYELCMSYSCVRCCLATSKHKPMSPLLVTTQQAHTHVSIAGQHPASTRPCLQCCAAPTTNVSISNRMSLDRMKIPRVVPENVSHYKCNTAAAEQQQQEQQQQQQQQQSWPQWSQRAVPGEEPLTLTKLRKRGRTRLGNYNN